MTEKQIIKVFKKRAKELGMNQLALSRKSGFTPPAISMLFTGKRGFLLRNFLRVLKALKLEVIIRKKR